LCCDNGKLGFLSDLGFRSREYRGVMACSHIEGIDWFYFLFLAVFDFLVESGDPFTFAFVLDKPLNGGELACSFSPPWSYLIASLSFPLEGEKAPSTHVIE
jgi:hypothetical protein